MVESNAFTHDFRRTRGSSFVIVGNSFKRTDVPFSFFRPLLSIAFASVDYVFRTVLIAVTWADLEV